MVFASIQQSHQHVLDMAEIGGESIQTCFYGMTRSPCLIAVYSQTGGGSAFILQVENEIRSF